MKKVAIYPFNKITHGLLRFRDLLGFEIESVIDFNFCIGKDAGEEIAGERSNIMVTDNIEQALDKCDTLILNDPGTPMDSFKEFYEEKKLRDKWKDLVLISAKKGKKIVSTHLLHDKDLCEWLKTNSIELSFYSISHDECINFINENCGLEVQENQMKKIAVYGTRSCLGKFTAQMSLYREIKKSKKAMALITEPTGFLFEMPQTAYLHANVYEAKQYVNCITKKAENDGYEYIIMADQGSIAESKMLQVILPRFCLLQGFKPNIVILVVGYDDDIEIRNCIDVLRVYGDVEKPFALLLPDRIEVQYGKYEVKTKEEIEKRKKNLKMKFGINNIETIKDISRIGEIITNGSPIL